MTTLTIPRHLVPIVEAAIRKEIDWFNALTPDAQDLWAGPLDARPVVVLIGLPEEAIFAPPSVPAVASRPQVEAA